MAVRRARVSSDSSCIAAFSLRREIVAECEAKRLDTTDLNHEEKRICVCIQNEPWSIKSGQKYSRTKENIKWTKDQRSMSVTGNIASI